MTNLIQSFCYEVEASNFKFVLKHIEDGFDINAKDTSGRVPLMYSQDPEMTRLLLWEGADVNAKSGGDTTALMISPNAEITWILLEAGADVNARNPAGYTALMLSKNAEMTSLLLGYGADVNSEDNLGRTTLMRLTQNAEMIRMLLEAGAYVNALDFYGWTALTHFTQKSRMFFEVGTDVNALEDTLGVTEIYHLLLDAGAIVDHEKTMRLLPFVRKLCLKRIFDICVGLQSLELSALELLAIVDESNPSMTLHLTMKEKWDAIVAVKHFHDKK
ncbi:MAG: ankyrin repeat domain-containing protein [Saprospiraceae bacterium]